MSRHFVAALSVVLLVVLVTSSGAAAKQSKIVELRVEGNGETLDEGTWYVPGQQSVRRGATPKCKARPGLDLFNGASALTLLAAAQQSNGRLRAIRTRATDYGPQVCQIGDLRSFGTYPAANGGFSYYVNYSPGFSSADVGQGRERRHRSLALGLVWKYASGSRRSPGGQHRLRLAAQWRSRPR